MQVACPTCKGSGRAVIRFTDHTSDGNVTSGESGVECWRCEGRGHSPKTFLEDTITWCECTGEQWSFGGYPQGPHGSCSIPKEHVHCGTCGKISQLG